MIGKANHSVFWGLEYKNVFLSMSASTDLIAYFMMVITGIGIDHVALIFASFEKCIEEANEKDRKWGQSCRRSKK